jgi:hypothetical protein
MEIGVVRGLLRPSPHPCIPIVRDCEQKDSCKNEYDKWEPPSRAKLDVEEPQASALRAHSPGHLLLLKPLFPSARDAA